jgi:hypothetical protein
VPLAPPHEHFPPVDVTLRGGNAAVVRVCTEEDAAAWMSQHQKLLGEHGAADAAWDWVEITRRAARDTGFLCLGLEHAEEMYGLMELGATSATRESSRRWPGLDIIYIEHLTSRPGSRGNTIGPRAVAGVGSILINAARNLAQILGYSGRVGLHSDPDAEGFYIRAGFTPGRRELYSDGEWLYFEIAGEES